MMDIFARIARSQIAINNASWVTDHIDYAFRLVCVDNNF